MKNPKIFSRLVILFTLFTAATTPTLAQVQSSPDQPAKDQAAESASVKGVIWPAPFALPGTVVLWGGGEVPTSIKNEVAALSPLAPHLWLTPTADAANAVNILAVGGVVAGEAKDVASLVPGLTINDPKEREVSLKLPQGTGIVIARREIKLLGSGKITWTLPASATREAAHIEQSGNARQDWVALRRAAEARADGIHTGTPGSPIVKSGTLIIGGGGGLPESVWKRFIELAGGENAPIVLLPTAQPDPMEKNPKGLADLLAAGAKNVTVLTQRTPDQVKSPEFIETLKKARGVWFVGGRQWKYVDAYEQTPAVDLFRDVLRRGGVIGGTSAGSAIQAEYMVRGSPLGNRSISAEGYEQGFAFLPGTAIDIHLSERARLEQLQVLIKKYPQFLGLGVDETGACEVSGSTMKVLGNGKAYVVDHGKTTELKPGAVFDLIQRK